MKIKEQEKRQKRGSVKRFTLPERLKIIELYYTGYFTVRVLCKKYKISVDLFRKWLREYESRRLSSLQDKNQAMATPQYKDKDEEIAALKKELKAKEEALRFAALKQEALELIINIAEEKFNIKIKKKSGK
ncbi:transposase [Flexithrix dorotheae]|uniref:transposase n=1 Tax=Flexithrix dorotheae TaxID=70993 RepID=UPI0003791834|nr:helix-turn-helix domain-containing protein [Flexithrix dorotheae]